MYGDPRQSRPDWQARPGVQGPGNDPRRYPSQAGPDVYRSSHQTYPGQPSTQIPNGYPYGPPQPPVYPQNPYPYNNQGPQGPYGPATQPGQFAYPPFPPQPPLPPRQWIRPYGKAMLVFLTMMMVTALICLTFAESVSVCLFIGLLISVMIMDWRGFTTLAGRLKWEKIQGGKRFLLICTFLGLSIIMLIIYLINCVLSGRTDGQAIHGHVVHRANSPRPALALIVGGIITIFFLISTVAANAPTSSATTVHQPLQPVATKPVQQSKLLPTPTSQPKPLPTATPTPVPTRSLQPTPAPTQPPQPTPAPTQPPQPTQAPTQPTQAPVQSQPPQPTHQPAPQPTQPPAQLSITFTGASATDYDIGTVSVHTLPGAALTIEVVYCSGHAATSHSLQGTSYADAAGNDTWSWEPETKCTGPATATVTASANGQSITSSDSFVVQ